MKLAIDLDGVQCDFVYGFNEVANELFPGIVDKNYQFVAWDDPVFDGKQDAIWKHIKATPRFWASLRIYPDNVKQLIQNVNLDDEIYFVTSRVPTLGGSVAEQSRDWVRTRIFPYRHFEVVPVKTGKLKWQIFNACDIEASIDDYDVNVRTTLQVVQQDKSPIPDHKVFLLDQPWNRDAHDLDEVRVGSINEFFERIR